MKTSIIYIVLFISMSSFFCGTPVYYIKPSDWESPIMRDSTIKYYSQFYKGWTLFLDPGHGGKDRFNMGPAKDAIEADINLKLALTLTEYLEKAGAKVILSRKNDTTVDLIDRSRISNNSRSDIFISIHHNALGNSDHFTNYTSTWYHAKENEINYHPSNHDIAKYIQRDLAFVMGNSGSLASFDGTMSDYLVYPNSGFSVLRNANIPAVLLECSFFSSAYEEQRLKIPEFNEIEAWGVFRGLGKYIKNGIPKLEYIGETIFQNYRPLIQIKALDKFGIDSNFILVRLDSQKIKFSFDPFDKIITFTPEYDLSNGDHLLEVIVKNRNGNHSFPFKKIITISPPISKMSIEIYPKIIPPEEYSSSLVLVKAFDKKGNPVTDGTRIEFSVSKGSANYYSTTRDGVAQIYVSAPSENGIGILKAQANSIILSDTIIYDYTDNRYIMGRVTDVDNNPISNCTLTILAISDSTFASPIQLTTREDGIYIISERLKDSIEINYKKDGYFGETEIIQLNKAVIKKDIILNKVADGILHNKYFVIDPRFGGKEKGFEFDDLVSSNVNLDIASYLFKLLKASGSNVKMTRTEDKTISEESRARLTKNIRRGFYIRIDVSDQDKLSITQSPNIQNTEFSNALLNSIKQINELEVDKIYNSRENIFSWSGISTISIGLPSLKSVFFKKDNLKFLESQLAWGIYHGILTQSGFSSEQTKTIKYKILLNDQPAQGIESILDNSLISVSNNDGDIFFYNVSGGNGKLTILTEGLFNVIK